MIRVVVPLVSEARGNAVFRECPHFLDEPVVDFFGPLAREESNDFVSPVDELRSVLAKVRPEDFRAWPRQFRPWRV